jgi:GDP-mannose 6-dehydrogenase
LKPGFAFDGSCFPKDVRSQRLKILNTGLQRVGILGLSFTDDLRESPVIGLIRDLWQDGIDVMVHDPDVQPEQMIGSNLEYLERQLPQIYRIPTTDLSEVLEKSQVIVVAQKRPEFTARLNEVNGKITVLDLVRMDENVSSTKIHNYQGMSW